VIAIFRDRHIPLSAELSAVVKHIGVAGQVLMLDNV
jgi:hypothetical protein